LFCHYFIQFPSVFTTASIEHARKWERANLRPRLPLTRRADCQWPDNDSGAPGGGRNWASKCGKYGVRNRPRNHKGSRPAKQAPATCVCAYHLRCKVHAPFPPPPVSILSITAPSPTRPLPAGEAAGTNRARSRVFVLSPHGAPPRPRSGRSPSGPRPSSAGSRWGRSSFSGEFPAILCPACGPVGSVVRLRRGFVSGGLEWIWG